MPKKIKKPAVCIRPERYEHIKELEELKSKFLATVSHQLRTPLNAIRWNLEMILAGDIGKLAPEQENFIRLTYKSCQAIIQIVDDLITGMEVEEGRVTLKKLETRIEELVDSVISEVKPIVAIKKINLQFLKPRTPLPHIKIDPVKIKQVISKLVDNAVKYTEEGGEVIIELKSEKNQLIFSVRDTGIGIPEAEKEKIFEKFYRASNATRTQQNASGLGLYVAKAFILAHGGKIWFESKEGKGTTFYFSLPLKE